MLDRSQYPSPHAPPAEELIKKWKSNTPSGADIEHFFLHELCETAADDYFLAVSDVFFDAISIQTQAEQHFSLQVLGFRLLEAAYKATEADKELAEHFHHALKKFAKLFYEAADFSNPPVNKHQAILRQYCLAVHAALNGDLALAHLIFRPDEA